MRRGECQLETSTSKMIDVIRRSHRWAVEHNVFDQMCQTPFAWTMLRNEAALVSHEYCNARFIALPGQDRKSYTVFETTHYRGTPIGGGAICGL
ncbi:hypothetical protein ASE89_14905 [Sphingomonas sp. Leaf30]|nr:hypothetical protein ASE89_14905 [Sphingomonas sp. Leaf30]